MKISQSWQGHKPKQERKKRYEILLLLCQKIWKLKDDWVQFIQLSVQGFLKEKNKTMKQQLSHIWTNNDTWTKDAVT